MMLKSNLQNSANFYLDKNASYKNAHLVTTGASNEALGISHIGLRNPESMNDKAPIFKGTLELVNGLSIFFDIFGNKDGQTLSVRWPQETYQDAEGRTQYVNKVNVPSAITAQVLRYASQHVVVQEAPAPEASVVTQEAPVVEGMTQEQLAELIASVSA